MSNKLLKNMKTGKRMLAIFMSIAIAFTFMPAVPQIGLGADEAYAAAGDVVQQGTFRGMDWKIVETADGYEAQIGNPDAEQEYWYGDYSGTTAQDFIDRHINYMENPPKDAYQMAQLKRSQLPWLGNGNDKIVTSFKVIGKIKAHGAIQLWFAGMQNLKSVTGLEKIDMEDVYYINDLFRVSQTNPETGERDPYAEGLEQFDGYQFWNTRNVTSLNHAFAWCPISSIDVSRWNTSNVISMIGTFRESNVEKLDLSGWDTGSCMNTGNMFNTCKKLTNLDLTGFKTGKVTGFGAMFVNCVALEEIKGIEGFDTHSGKQTAAMFASCTKLESLDLSNWDVSNVSDMNWMFQNCPKLTDIKGLENWDTSNVTKMRAMFNYCPALKNCDMLEFDVSNVEIAYEMIKNLKQVGNAIQDKIDKMKAEGKTDESPEIVALNKAKELALNAIAGKNANGDPVTEENMGDAVDLMKEVAKQYAQAVIAEAKANAENLIEAAKKAEAESLADPTNKVKQKKAEEAREAAAKAVDKVANLASNTGRQSDKNDLTNLENKLAEDVENPAVKRLTEDLNGLIATAEAIDTDGKSAASVRGLADALEKAKKALENGDSKALAEAVSELEDAIKVISDPASAKSDAEKNYEKLKAETETLVEAARAAEKELEAALTAADTSKAEAEAAAAKAAETGKAEDYENAVKAAEKYEADVAAVKEKTDNLKEAAEKAYAKALEARNVAKETGNKDLVKESDELANLSGSLSNNAKTLLEALPVMENGAAEKTLKAMMDNAEAIAKEKPGSPEAIAAAEDARKKAEEIVEAAKKTGDEAKIKEAEKQLNEAIANEIEQKTVGSESVAKDAEGNTNKAKADADKVAGGKTQADLDTAKKALKDAQDTLAALEVAKKNAEDALTAAKAAQAALPADATDEQKKAAQDAVDKAQAALDKVNDQITKTTETITHIQTIVVKIEKQINAKKKVYLGKKYKVAKNTYKVTRVATAKKKGIVTFTKAKNARNITVPKTVKLRDGRRYIVNRVAAKAFTAKKIRKVTAGANVKKLNKNAFKNSKAKTLVLKTKKLKKASVKGSLKGSKITKIKVSVGKKSLNKKYVKKYKKIFTKKNCGKKVKVAR